MIDYTPRRVLHRMNQDGTPFDRHIKLTVTDTKLELLSAVGPITDIKEADDGALIDASLAGQKVLVHPNFVLELEKWQKRLDWKERCHWIIAPVTDSYSTPISLINRTADQMSRRLHSAAYNISRPLYYVQLFVPFKDSDFSEISLRVIMPTDQSKFFCNKKFEMEKKGNPIMLDVPTLKLSGPRTVAPDGTVVLHVSNVLDGKPTGRTSSVDLQTQSGYLPKTRVELRDGEADFKVTALGLEPGDKIKIKAGFFFFPSADEYVVTVE